MKKITIYLILLAIILISVILRFNDNETPLREFSIGDSISVKVFSDNDTYRVTLSERGKILVNKKTQIQPIFRSNPGIYFDYTTIDFSDYRLILGAVQDASVKSVAFRNADISIEQNVDQEQLFLLVVPSSVTEHPIITLTNGQQIEYPFSK